jgi:pimeloyl-ACP methyl ester carboxylesterase
MKRSLFILSIIAMLVSALASAGHCKTVVFFIGGWRMTHEQMKSFSRSVSESRKVKYFLPEELSELVRPWHCADLIYNYIKSNNMSDEELIFVSFSFGGIVAQWLLSDHPELHVKKLILVGSPIGGYKFVPPNNFFSNRFPKDLPIYVIAGNKGQNAWFLRDENDGVVDLKSALDIPDQNLKNAAIFYADHTELEEMPEVQARISMWLDLGQEAPRNFMAYNNAGLSASTDNRLFSVLPTISQTDNFIH